FVALMSSTPTLPDHWLLSEAFCENGPYAKRTLLVVSVSWIWKLERDCDGSPVKLFWWRMLRHSTMNVRFGAMPMFLYWTIDVFVALVSSVRSSHHAAAILFGVFGDGIGSNESPRKPVRQTLVTKSQKSKFVQPRLHDCLNISAPFSPTSTQSYVW